MTPTKRNCSEGRQRRQPRTVGNPSGLRQSQQRSHKAPCLYTSESRFTPLALGRSLATRSQTALQCQPAGCMGRPAMRRADSLSVMTTAGRDWVPSVSHRTTLREDRDERTDEQQTRPVESAESARTAARPSRPAATDQPEDDNR